ncbi:LOW QUALITY PROTEIN: hypothetical protein V2J09_014509 [Rumex salicifolius]
MEVLETTTDNNEVDSVQGVGFVGDTTLAAPRQNSPIQETDLGVAEVLRDLMDEAKVKAPSPAKHKTRQTPRKTESVNSGDVTTPKAKKARVQGPSKRVTRSTAENSNFISMEGIRNTIPRRPPTTAPLAQNGAVSGSRGDSDCSAEFGFPKTEEFDLERQSSSPISGRHSINQRRSISAQASSQASARASFQRNTPLSGRDDERVIRCTSNASFQRKSALSRAKTKSRLIDPQERKSERLGRSGILQSTPENFDDDDPFLDDDMPDEYNQTTFGCFSIFQLVSLILIVAALVCSLVIPKYKRKTVWEMQLWKWGVMIMVLICGGLVSGWLIRILVFLFERNFLLRKRVLYFVYGLRNAVQKCLWLSLVLLSWNLILGQKVESKTHGKYLRYITKILVCLLVATIIWLLKTLLVKVLAMSFHVTAFFDRIQDALFSQYVIETLSRPPFIEIETICDEDAEEQRIVSEVERLRGFGRSPTLAMPMTRKEKGITIDRLHRLNRKNVSAWNMKRLMSLVRKGVLSTLDEHLPGSMTTTTAEDETSMHIRSEKQAKSAAKRIFDNVASPGSKYIYEEDLMHFMRDDEAIKTMHLFEGSTECDGISKKALKNWVVVVFRERRALALSLNDTKTAVNKLHNLLSVLLSFGVLIIWLLILDVSITRFLVFISSQLLLLTFVFGNTFKTTFEAIIFLFVMHPFDVGDRCEIDEVQMVVEEMNILTTVFLRYDNQKVIYPNSVLATKPISNYYRSPDMGEGIDFCVHISTSVQKIAVMKERITRQAMQKYSLPFSHLQKVGQLIMSIFPSLENAEKKKEHWYPSPMIVMRDIEDMNRLKFSVWLSHTMNHQDMGERWERRALLVEEMVKIFKDLDVEYRMLPMDVNIRALPSLVSDRFPSNWSAYCSDHTVD